MKGPHTYAIDFVIGLLREDADLKAAGVQVISQNDGEVVDKMTNNQPGVRVSGTVAVSEYVPLNRRPGKDFLTALDVAALAQIALDRHDVHSGEVAHGTPGKGVLEATCAWELELLVKNGPNETPTETETDNGESDN